MVREAPRGHDRPAAADDPGDAPRGQRDVAQQHAGVHGDVVDALLALLDDRVAVDLPRQLFRFAVDLFQRLVDRHGADRDRRVADDPLARLVDPLAGGEVHDRVGAPAGRPDHLVDLFLDRRPDGRVAHVGVDLHQEVLADDHRLGLGVLAVDRDHRAAAGHLVAHELRGNPFARGNVLHFAGDDALLGPAELGVVLAPVGPAGAQPVQSTVDVDGGFGIRVRARSVVDVEVFAVREVDPARRNPESGFGLVVNLVRSGDRTRGDGDVFVLQRRQRLSLPTPALPGQVHAVGDACETQVTLSARHGASSRVGVVPPTMPRRVGILKSAHLTRPVRPGWRRRRPWLRCGAR